MTKDEALDLALEALESFAPHNGVFWRNWHKDDAEIATAITAIKQARSAPVQEPLTNLEGLKLAYRHPWLNNLSANAVGRMALRDAFLQGIRDAEAAHNITGEKK